MEYQSNINSLYDLLKKPTTINIILFIGRNRNSYSSKISKELGITYRTMWINLFYLTNKNIVVKKKNHKFPKIKYLCLTKKGKDIFKKINELDILLSN